MPIDTTILAAVALLVLIAVVDVWVSRLSTASKVLWTFTLVFLVGVGPFAWILTRASAYREPDHALEEPASA